MVPALRRTLEDSIGDSVRATTPEISTAPASENANSVNRLPTRPPMKPMGAYTATSVVVMAMMGSPSSRAPSMAAWKRDLPISMWRCTFSTTTMASSTTRPMASTMASSVSRFTEKPAINIRKAAPISDSGTATAGTSAARSDPRER